METQHSPGRAWYSRPCTCQTYPPTPPTELFISWLTTRLASLPTPDTRDLRPIAQTWPAW
ncbi:unnamed protein product [Leptidea sinapis]|uniref:Uncharacterized protein n=1 Tax=Leptidea sinapis TaxID=189913 RepID=A0A5E4Q6I4_9NEOP|nr:unnamed protein product [Leptidea sinapis]